MDNGFAIAEKNASLLVGSVCNGELMYSGFAFAGKNVLCTEDSYVSGMEQLVEVPTVVSYSFLQQQLAKQDVDIPVPGALLRGHLQGFLTGHGSTASHVCPLPRSWGILKQCFWRQRQASSRLHRRRQKRTILLRKSPSSLNPSLFRRRRAHSRLHRRRRRRVLHVLKFFTQDRVQERLVDQTLLLAFKALYQDRVQRRLVEQIFAPSVSASASWRASGVDGGAPMVMGAPSRTHGLSFILKAQPMSTSWRRTSTREGEGLGIPSVHPGCHLAPVTTQLEFQ